MMLHVVLYRPEIPQNTGNIGRMCAVTQSRLHLIHPLGFSVEDRYLKRSGLDYWDALDVHHHSEWKVFLESPEAPDGRLFLFTTRAERSLWDTNFRDGDGLIFGNEGSGAPDWIHLAPGVTRVRIPQFNPQLRSLNLSTAAGIAVYEALRQLRG